MWEIPAEQFAEGGLGLLPLAPVAQIAETEVPSLIRKMDSRLLAETPSGEYAKLWTATYLMMVLRYEEAIIDVLLQGVRNMRESVTYQAILREGREEGKEHMRDMLFKQGQKRFGTPDAKTIAAIHATTDFEALELLGERLMEVENWSELLAEPGTTEPGN